MATWFDAGQYLTSNPDLPQDWSDSEAWSHYQDWGADEGRVVNFNASEYNASYPDVDAASITAAEHYVKWGMEEGRALNFNATDYLANNPDVADAGLDALTHYKNYGMEENRPVTFDSTKYLNNNPDVADSVFGSSGSWTFNGAEVTDGALAHYLKYGKDEGRPVEFDSAKYLDTYTDVADSPFGSSGSWTFNGAEVTDGALAHYLKYGMDEGRNPTPGETVSATPGDVDHYTLTDSTNKVTEGNTVTYTVEAVDADGNPVNVSSDTSFTYNMTGDDLGGAASEASPDDVDNASGTVTIAAGESSATFDVTAIADGTSEGLEGMKYSILDDDFNVEADEVTAIEDKATGESYTLKNADSTEGAADDITGTPQDDTFKGYKDESFTSDDILDGAGGTDVLNARYVVDEKPDGTQNAGNDSIEGNTQSIEQVFVRPSWEGTYADGTDFSFDLDSMTGVQELWNDGAKNTTKNDASGGADETFTFQNVDLSTTVGLQNTGVATDVTYADTTGDNTASFILDGVMEETAGTTNTDDGQESALNADGIETFDITSQNSANTLSNLTGDSVQTVNVSGDADFDVSGLAGSITSVDASALNASFEIEAGTTDLNITGTANADTFDFQGNLDSNDTVDGGAGTDVLSVSESGSISSSSFNNVTNIEELMVSDDTDASVDVTALGDAFQTVDFSIEDNADSSNDYNVTLNGLVSGESANLSSANLTNGDLTTTSMLNSLGTVTMNLADASASDDSLTATLKNNNSNSTVQNNVSNYVNVTGMFTINTLDIPGTETVTLESTGALGINNILNLNTSDATTINVTGDQDVMIGNWDNNNPEGLSASNLDANDQLTVDASNAGGDVTMEFVTDHEHNVTGSDQNDAFAFTSNSFDQDDVVDGGAGNDVVMAANIDGDIGDVQLSNVELATFHMEDAGGTKDIVSLAQTSGLQNAIVDVDNLGDAVTLEEIGSNNNVTLIDSNAGTISGNDITFETQTGVTSLNLTIGEDGDDGIDGSDLLNSKGGTTTPGTAGEDGLGIDMTGNAIVLDSNVTDATVTVEGEGGSGGTGANTGADGADGADAKTTINELKGTGLTSLTVNMSNSANITLDAINAAELTDLTLNGGDTSDVDTTGMDVFTIDAAGNADTSSLNNLDASNLDAQLQLGTASAIDLADGASVTGTNYNDTIYWNINDQSGVSLDAGNDQSNGGDELILEGSQNIGGGIIDLSKDDQVTQLNGQSNSATQTGFENVDASAVTGDSAINIDGNASDNEITGTKNSDILNGADGADEIVGDSDSLSAQGVGNDTIDGGAGNDLLIGDTTSSGVSASDSLSGGKGDDTLFGGSATREQQTIEVTTAKDNTSENVTVLGHTINLGDSAESSTSATASTIAEAINNDSVINRLVTATVDQSTVTLTYDIDGDVANSDDAELTSNGALTVNNSEDVTGSVTDTSADTLNGDAGNDVLIYESNDTTGSLDGGTGSDWVVANDDAGGGLDVSNFNNIDNLFAAQNLTGDGDANTLILPSAGGGSSLTGNAGDDVLIGGGADNAITGGDGDDYIHAGAGADTTRVKGNAGADTINGGQGADSLTGNAGKDTFVIDEFDAVDTIADFDGQGDDTLKLDDTAGESGLATASFVHANNPDLFSTAATGVGGISAWDNLGTLSAANLHGSTGQNVTAGISDVLSQLANVLQSDFTGNNGNFTTATATISNASGGATGNGNALTVTLNVSATADQTATNTLNSFSLNALVIDSATSLHLVNIANKTADTIQLTAGTASTTTSAMVTFTVTSGDTGAVGNETGKINTLAIDTASGIDAGDIVLA